MTIIQSIILGIVEGLTEYLPISSTGHLYLAAAILGIGGSDAAKSFEIVIQLGAILAVTSLYASRFKSIIKGLSGKDEVGKKLAVNLIIAFLPAAFVGIALEKVIKNHLFGLWPISAAWIIGGFVIFAVSKRLKGKSFKGGFKLEDISTKQAAIIGCAQCFALWPGVSRSLATIMGATLLGVSMEASVEFSFLLGFITLGTATLYEGLKQWHTLIAAFGWVSPLFGLIVAYISAIIAIKWMVSYISRKGMNPFAYYRILLGCVVAILMIARVL